jgi:hypothetical protein
MTEALVPQRGGDLAAVDIWRTCKFLRLHTANGDASPETRRSYYTNAGQFVAWCAKHDINPATEDDIAVYCWELVGQRVTGMVAVKLAA